MLCLLKLNYRIPVHHSLPPPSSQHSSPLIHPSFLTTISCVSSLFIYLFMFPVTSALSFSLSSPRPRSLLHFSFTSLQKDWGAFPSLLITIIDDGPAAVFSHPASLCCTSARTLLLTQGKAISSSWSRACSERLRSLPGSGAWSSPLCIKAVNFNLYHVTVACTEKKQAGPLAAVFPSGVRVLQCRLSVPGRSFL